MEEMTNGKGNGKTLRGSDGSGSVSIDKYRQIHEELKRGRNHLEAARELLDDIVSDEAKANLDWGWEGWFYILATMAKRKADESYRHAFDAVVDLHELVCTREALRLRDNALRGRGKVLIHDTFNLAKPCSGNSISVCPQFRGN
jgi:hypothetical protein